MCLDICHVQEGTKKLAASIVDAEAEMTGQLVFDLQDLQNTSSQCTRKTTHFPEDVLRRLYMICGIDIPAGEETEYVLHVAHDFVPAR